MNNNRGNNRRRGRGNNRQQGGQQMNRIDSRARGNAPQLLEKYRKLAHDAHLNGDRVTEEYYLQFADHYFRVLADQRQRQDEQRGPRRDERSYDYNYDGDNEGEDEPAMDRGPRHERDSRPQPVETEDAAQSQDAGEGEAQGDVGRSMYEPVANPFVRDNRGNNGKGRNKPRGRGRDDDQDTAQDDGEASGGEQDNEQFNLSSALPPSISNREDRDQDAPARKPRARTVRKPRAEDAEKPAAANDGEAEEKPRARRRPRKASPSDGGSDSLETVG